MGTDPYDSLDDLLRRASAQAAAPIVARDLAARARRKIRRRARRRSVGIAAGCVACALLAVLLSRLRARLGDVSRIPGRADPLHPQATPAGPDQIRFELARLNGEAAVYQLQAEELMRVRTAQESFRHAEELLAQPSAAERINSARQRTALMLVRDAERAAGGTGHESDADESYRRAARLFPDTPAGRLAAGRLKTHSGST